MHVRSVQTDQVDINVYIVGCIFLFVDFDTCTLKKNLHG